VSSSGSITYYEISGQIGNANQQDTISVRLTSAAGNTDAVALALAGAINSIDLPPGITVSVSMAKNAESTTTSFADLTSQPPTFL
jgi:hypothetical protein